MCSLLACLEKEQAPPAAVTGMMAEAGIDHKVNLGAQVMPYEQ